MARDLPPQLEDARVPRIPKSPRGVGGRQKNTGWIIGERD
jgi:hypothetical protein